MTNLQLPCPYRDCGGRMRIAAELVERMPTWSKCICHARDVAIIPDETGAPTLAGLAKRDPRKGERVLARYAYRRLSGETDEWHTIEAVTYGGPQPRRADGSPIHGIVGVIEEGEA